MYASTVSQKNGCRSYFGLAADTVVQRFAADELTINGESSEVVLSSASSVFSCLMSVYTIWHFSSLPPSPFCLDLLPSVL